MNQANFIKFVLALLGNYHGVLFQNKFSVEDVSVSGNVKDKRENFLFIDN